MKKLLLILFAPALFALASSCNKSTLEGNGCINVIKRPLNPIGADAYSKVKTIFQNNNIDITGLNFYRAIFDDAIPLNGQVNVYNHFFALQYFNGLPLLNSDVAYHFSNGKFTSSSGQKFNNVALDNRSVLSTQQLRKLYLAEAAKDGFSAGGSLKDSCLSAEFGYYNLYLNATAASSQIIKAWKVTPANRDYPVAYIRDDNAAVLSYFNGIYTFTN